jgi:hypothetical protein
LPVRGRAEPASVLHGLTSWSATPMPDHEHPTAPRARRIPDVVWSPLVAGLIILVPGLVGLATGKVLLFPSLAPTAILQAHTPEHPSARAYNVVVAHLLGLFIGFGAVVAFGIATAPSVFELRSLSPERVGATVVAMMVALLLEHVLRATHPPAAATTLLVALGAFKPTMRDTVAVVSGVLMVAVVGEAFRRLRRVPAS